MPYSADWFAVVCAKQAICEFYFHTPSVFQYGMKGVCAGHVRRTALVDGARIGAQNAILCLCNATLGIHLRVHGAHNIRYKSPSGARKSNIPYWSVLSKMDSYMRGILKFNYTQFIFICFALFQGHVTSYYGSQLHRYTAFQAHLTDIKQIIPDAFGVLSLTSNQVRYTTRQGLKIFLAV